MHEEDYSESVTEKLLWPLLVSVLGHLPGPGVSQLATWTVKRWMSCNYFSLAVPKTIATCPAWSGLKAFGKLLSSDRTDFLTQVKKLLVEEERLQQWAQLILMRMEIECHSQQLFSAPRDPWHHSKHSLSASWHLEVHSPLPLMRESSVGSLVVECRVQESPTLKTQQPESS